MKDERGAKKRIREREIKKTICKKNKKKMKKK